MSTDTAADQSNRLLTAMDLPLPSGTQVLKTLLIAFAVLVAYVLRPSVIYTNGGGFLVRQTQLTESILWLADTHTTAWDIVDGIWKASVAVVALWKFADISAIDPRTESGSTGAGLVVGAVSTSLLFSSIGVATTLLTGSSIFYDSVIVWVIREFSNAGMAAGALMPIVAFASLLFLQPDESEQYRAYLTQVAVVGGVLGGLHAVFYRISVVADSMITSQPLNEPALWMVVGDASGEAISHGVNSLGAAIIVAVLVIIFHRAIAWSSRSGRRSAVAKTTEPTAE